MCKFRRLAIFTYFLLFLTSARNPALAQNAHDPNTTGIALAAKDPDGIQGITAHDIFSLVDTTLGSDFDSLTMVFNDCFGEAFQDAANNTTNLKKGNVAVLTASGKTGSAYAPGDLNGNAFARGFAEKLMDDNNATLVEAFDNGKVGINRLVEKAKGQSSANHPEIKIAKTSPTSTYFGKGEKIVPGGEVKRKMAILFVGKPENFADWTDLQRQFQALINLGWKKQDIAIFFGDTPDGHRDGPLVSANLTVKDNATNNNKDVEFTYTDPENGQPKDMPIWHRATYENLKREIAKIHAYAGLSENKPMEVFIWFGGHDTSQIMNRKDASATEQKSSTHGGGRAGRAPTSTRHRKPGKMASGDVGLGAGRAPSRVTEQVANFSGFHAGGSIGARGAWSNDLTNLDQITEGGRDATPDPTSNLSNTSAYANLFLNYGAELPRDFYIGAQAFVGYGNNSRTIAGIPGTGAIASAAVRENDGATAKETWNAGLLGKFGKELHPGSTPILVSGLAGIGFQHVSIDLDCTAAGACGTNGIVPGSLSASAVLVGFLAGVEVQVPAAAFLPASNSIISFQYLHGDYGHFNAVVGEPAQIQINMSKRVTTDTFTTGFSWPF
jgi:hypothetical protein